MKPSAQLQCALEILEEYQVSKGPLLDFAKRFLKNKRYAGSRDRRSILEVVLSAIRWDSFLEEYFGDLPNARGLLLAHLVAANTKDIESYFQGEVYGLSPLTPQEKEVLLKLETLEFVEENKLPNWLSQKLKEQFQKAPLDVASYLAAKPVHLSVNLEKTSRREVICALERVGIEARKSKYSKLGLVLEERSGHLDQLEPLRSGQVMIQNEGSQLISLLLDSQSHERILDLCAGAGGKSLSLKFLCPDLDLDLFDISQNRLAKAKARFHKAGLGANFLEQLPSFNQKTCNQKSGEAHLYDKILIDAPCSGTGTLSKTPEFSRLMTKEKMAALVETQVALLKESIQLLKPGGEILYATCSILREENEDVIQRALSELESEAKVAVLQEMDISTRVGKLLSKDWGGDKEMTAEGATLTLRPDGVQFDGFKITLLRKL